MFERFDESELLALIEDQLDPQDAQRLRRRLAADPHLLARIEQLREDRVLLRTAPEPRVPEGLLAELEPILARPMLMPDAPARRRSRRPLVTAIAAAAALGAFAGVWATIIGVISSRSSPAPELVEAQPAGPPPADLGATETRPLMAEAEPEPWPPPGTVVHHQAPVLAVSGPPPSTAGDARRADAGRAGDPSLVTASFMLVVRVGDQAEVEQMLRRVLADLPGETALVRNFTYEEADELGESMRLAEGRRHDDTAETGETVADARGEHAAPRHRAAHDLPARMPRSRAQNHPESKLTRSALIVGRRELVPSFERQLDFSERGATYTVCVPATRITQLLAQLQLDEQQQTALRVDACPTTPETTDEQRWLRDWPMVREAAEALESEGRDVVILLPVVVEESE